MVSSYTQQPLQPSPHTSIMSNNIITIMIFMHSAYYGEGAHCTLHSLSLLFLGLFPMYWAYQPWKLTVFRMQFFNFFSMICTRSTRMKNRPYWMVKISPEHGEKSRKIIDLKSVGLIRPFGNSLYHIPPLRRRGKILFVWYGPDSSVTQRSAVMRKLRKSTTALRLTWKWKWKQFSQW